MVRADEVDWSRVEAGYGPADEVPSLLASLYSPDPAERDRAIGELWSCLCHQGTVYEASAVAVPFLLDAARDAPLAPPERTSVLALIAHIGRREGTCWRGYTTWEVVLACAAAVEAVLPRLAALAETEPVARPWVVVGAAYFPRTFATLGRDATDYLTDPDPRLSTLVALLVAEREPDLALIRDVAARDADTLDLVDEGLADVPLAQRAREVLLELAGVGLL